MCELNGYAKGKKCILVIGATGGIGEKTAEYLVSKGYFVVLVGRSTEKLSALNKALEPNSIYYEYDFKDLYNIESIFEYISDLGIKLDGLVHAAGINRDIAIRSNDVDTMQEVTAVNYMSFVEIMKYYMKKKYSNEEGSVVAVSSYATKDIAPAMCTYTASKAALEAAVAVAAKEGLKRKLRVNAILPSCVDTNMISNSGFLDRETADSRQPFGIIPTIHIAYLIEFLLSEKSNYITGAMIPITAGV